MQDNRYAPTQGALNSQQTVEPSEHGLGPTSRSRRFVNFLVDTVGCGIVGVGVEILLAIVWPQLLSAARDFQGSATSFLAANFLLNLIAGLIYYLPLEGATGRTLGKLITSTKVVSTRGTPLTFSQVLGRTLARYIPFEPFTFLKSSGVGLHDQIANTRVVSTRPAAST